MPGDEPCDDEGTIGVRYDPGRGVPKRAPVRVRPLSRLTVGCECACDDGENEPQRPLPRTLVAALSNPQFRLKSGQISSLTDKRSNGAAAKFAAQWGGQT